MAIPCFPSSTVEYVPALVTGTFTESTPVHMAVIPYDIEPDTDDWKTAVWDGSHAKVKIGTGTAVGALDEGLYGVWVKVTTADETPVIPSGSIRIT
jgi:hypothetical protein